MFICLVRPKGVSLVHGLRKGFYCVRLAFEIDLPRGKSAAFLKLLASNVEIVLGVRVSLVDAVDWFWPASEQENMTPVITQGKCWLEPRHKVGSFRLLIRLPSQFPWPAGAPRLTPRKSQYRWCSAACFVRFFRVSRPCWHSEGGRPRRQRA